jgi:chorismate-pyruvate lyase
MTSANAGAADNGAMHRRAARAVERLLSRWDGTVTAFLECVTGEAVEADVIAQAAIVATPRGPLDLEPGQVVIRRHAIVRGARSRREYLYAETLLVPDRLPAGVPDLLAATNDPIGRVLAARGFRMTRAVLDAPPRRPVVARLRPANSVAAAILARRSRVDGSGAAVMLIDEWFLRDLSAAVLASC